MASYNLPFTKARNFNEASIPDLFTEIAEWAKHLDENLTITNVSLDYDEAFAPYVTVYYE